MIILVTGSQGQLGQELSLLTNAYPELKFYFFSKSEWDISNKDISFQIISEYKPNFIINTAAYTKVDQAEIEHDLCFKINYEAPRSLAIICNDQNVRLLQISTDYVFYPNIHKPLIESFPKNPQGNYAISKSMAEDSILELNTTNIIIRTSWLYSTIGHNFVKTMIRLSQTGQILQVVNDQIGSPTYAADLAHTIVRLILSTKKESGNQINGIYHYSNIGVCSWYEFAKEIFTYMNLSVTINPISTLHFNALAPRPSFSQLDCSKIKNELHIEIPEWKTSLHKCLDKLLIQT